MKPYVKTKTKSMLLFILLLLPTVATDQEASIGLANPNHPLKISSKDDFSSIKNKIDIFSDDLDTVWTAANTGLTDTSVGSLAANGTNLFAGCDNGGVFLSTDNGESWKAINQGLTKTPREQYLVMDFAFNESGILVSLWFGGLFHSADNGANWTQVNRMNQWSSLAVSGNNLYAALATHSGSDGVYLSTDNGRSFVGFKNGLPPVWVRFLLISGTNLYAGCNPLDANNLTTETLFLTTTTDNGANWKPISIGFPSKGGVLALAVKGSTLFAGVDFNGVFISKDNGTTWSASNNGLPESLNVFDFLVHGKYIFAACGESGVFMSTDNGTIWKYIGLANQRPYDLCISGRTLFAGTGKAGIFKRTLPDTVRDVGVWQEIAIMPTSDGQFSSSIAANVVTFDGHQAKVLKANADSLVVRVPEALVGNRKTLAWADTTVREIDIIAKVVKAPGDSSTVCRERVRFLPPRPLLYDQVTRANPPIFQDIMWIPGPLGIRAFQFIGQSTDGTAAVRLLNTSLATPPLTLRGKVIAPDGELFEKTEDLTPGNLINLGNNNAGIQFPVSQDGLYLIIVEAADTDRNSPPPWSFGPFPASYQIHLAGNTGLPRKLINGAAEPARSIRLDTYFNHPAPRDETLLSFVIGANNFVETGLFKFANPVSVSRSPIAVLIPPAGGFTFENAPRRAAPPPVPGLLPNGIDPSVPMAQTPGAATLVLGTVIDFSQVPIPASVISPGPPPGVAAILGSRDGNSVSLPYAESITSLICDMGSGNEIVDGAGKDFRVIGASGNYSIAISNTPFADTFVPLGAGSGETEFDLTPAGLSTARYLLVSGTTSIDAIESINFFADRVDPQIGAFSDVGAATITMRRQKSPAGKLDPYLELIGPDGSAMGKNDSGFGDDTDSNHSDAALISIPLTNQGFHRFLGRGYDTQPDERSQGTFFARLETAGAFDPTKIVLSSASEELTQAQKKGIMNRGPRQRDSYLFQAEPGKTVNIVVNGITSGQTGALPDPLAELYDPEEMLIAANDNYTGRGKNAAMPVELPKNTQNGGALPNPSTYRIVVCGTDLLGNATGTNGGNAHSRIAAAGAYEVKVFTGKMSGEVSLMPTVSAITPDKAAVGATGVQVQISGSNFSAGATVSFSGSGITVGSVTVVNANQITAVIDVAANVAIERKNVTVKNADGMTGTGQALFEIRASLGKAFLRWAAPASGSGNAPPRDLSLSFDPLQKSLSAKPGIHPMSQQSSRQGIPVWTAGPLNPQIIVDEIEPNNSPDQAQVLSGDTVIVVKGKIAENRDREDLFKVTTISPGVYLRLSGFTSDCDLLLLNAVNLAFIASSANWGDTVPEEVIKSDLPTGTYLILVDNITSDTTGAKSTKYDLMVKGQLKGAAFDTVQSYRIYRSTVANARTTGNMITSVSSTRTDYTDPIPYTGQFHYQVAAVYAMGESAPSNEVSTLVTQVGDHQSHAMPATFDLLQNYPNPFNRSTERSRRSPETVIHYQLPKQTEVRLEIYNVLGELVRTLVNAKQPAGYYTMRWNGKDEHSRPVTSGVYLYRLTAGEFSQVKKMSLLR